MKNDELIKDLQNIGLSDKEARVYLATLELGQAAVQKIAEKADVNRATTYVVLESLMVKGLVTSNEHESKTEFIAESPLALNNIIREQEEELEKRDAQLDEVMPELNTLFNLHPNKPTVHFYEGKEGINQLMQVFLRSNQDGIEFFSLSDARKIFTPEEKIEWRKVRYKKKLSVQSLYTEETELDDELKISKDEFTHSIKVSSKEYPFYSDVVVFGDNVILAALRGQLSGVLITSPEIAETIRSVFRLAFNHVEKKSGSNN